MNVASSYLVSGKVPTRQGTAHISIVPYKAYAAKDGYFIVGALNNAQFERLCSAIKRPEFARDERYASNASRVANRKEVDDLLSTTFVTQPVSHWLELFESTLCCKFA